MLALASGTHGCLALHTPAFEQIIPFGGEARQHGNDADKATLHVMIVTTLTSVATDEDNAADKENSSDNDNDTGEDNDDGRQGRRQR
jgi:hypothetical protein